ncbi:hypothetical protein TSTA_034180 [Talaromyces stipitatus ATCC 10500]|uniref:Uncharacterized protein n=1 Tax=Talaromyces stipitatus (strain ATCC 10500 / CBS 375.48 / QM 6759 / NRRL 1006) TaxID=441959 RepID=B8M6V8_TALSN|nr:uncharacterized protein TSTA_034180 [Talaromyces stipitatus ATCC 10500]EED20178.1 hypothetical protein TSTA_034180 [Talaromyces stipitatus ATCC 10500]
MECVGFCPAGKVKVAMNTYNHSCYNRGYESYCCEPSYYTETTRLSDDIAAFQDALASYGANPTCSTTATRDLVGRDDSPVQQVKSFLTSFFLACNLDELQQLKGKIQVWDAWAVTTSRGTNPTRTSLVGWPATQRSGTRTSMTMEAMSQFLATFDLCAGDNFLCTEEGFDNQNLISGGGSDELKQWLQWKAQSRSIFGATDILVVGDWNTDDSIYDEALDNENVEDCEDCKINIESVVVEHSTNFHTEHIIELQSMSTFFAWLVTESSCNIDCQFFLKFFNKDVLKTTAMPGGYNSGVPSLRIMEALGSWSNTNQFRLLEKRLNGIKASLWSLDNLKAPDKWKAAYESAAPDEAITILKGVITVFSYLNYPSVWERLKATNALIRQELETAQDAYNDATGSQTKIADCWDQ